MSQKKNQKASDQPVSDATEVPEEEVLEGEVLDAVEVDGEEVAAATEESDQASEGEEAAAEADPAEEPEAAAEEEPDWKDRYVRSVAELENIRKRMRRDAIAGEKRGIARLAKELLPALDNLERALAHADEKEDEDTQLVEGLRIVHRELHAALDQVGIESFDPAGEQFDPHLHEALSQQPADESTLPGTVAITYQPGYRLGEDVLRAAKVVVAG